MMNPHVAMMGNMDLEARIKVDYSTLTYISDKTELETNTKKKIQKKIIKIKQVIQLLKIKQKLQKIINKKVKQ